MHEYWKKVKVGLIKDWDEIPNVYKLLLLKYYPQTENYLGEVKR